MIKTKLNINFKHRLILLKVCY